MIIKTLRARDIRLGGLIMQHCACRDCFEISASDVKVETHEVYDPESEDYVPLVVTTYPLCWECEAAGCTPAPVPYPEYPTPFESNTYACSREGMYQS